MDLEYTRDFPVVIVVAGLHDGRLVQPEIVVTIESTDAGAFKLSIPTGCPFLLLQ